MARPKVRLNDHAYDGHMQAAVRLTLLLQALAFSAAALSFVPLVALSLRRRDSNGQPSKGSEQYG
jgi:hypothetical protein